MTTNFQKFITEVEREINRKLTTKTSAVWRQECDADYLINRYNEEIDEYESGLTEDDDKNGIGFYSQSGKSYDYAVMDQAFLYKKLYEAWDLGFDFIKVARINVFEEEMRWEVYYDVVTDEKEFPIKVEIGNGEVEVLCNDEELDDDKLGNYTNLQYYKLLQILKSS